jgi:hypothetical protein
MQFDHQRAFPYPVLRHDVDDYTDGEFQVSVDIQAAPASKVITADIHCALSVGEIEKQIKSSNASFAIVVSCRDTYYRETIFLKEHATKHEFPAGLLRGEVQVNPYIVCTKEIVGFSCPLINKEFGAGPFRFRPGSVLALEEPKVVYVDRDVFKPITSVFELVKDENLPDGEWRVRLNQPKVAIAVSPAMKSRIDVARNSTRNQAVLKNSVYFAAVMHCIRSLREGADYDDHRWAQVMRQQCHNLGISLAGDDDYATAQKLMKLPLNLLGAYVFGEVSS